MGLQKGSGYDQHHKLGPTLLPEFSHLQDFPGSLPTSNNNFLAPSPIITKEQENPTPSLHTQEKPRLFSCPSLPAAWPFHTSRLHSFLLGVCQASQAQHQDHSEASVSMAITAKMFSSTMNTVSAAMLLQSPEYGPPHWSHNLLWLHVHLERQKNYTNCFVGVFLFRFSFFV